MTEFVPCAGKFFPFRVALFFKTHLCIASHKRDIRKECKPRSDVADRRVYTVSILDRNFYKIWLQ